jgi:hypothetical protein
MCGALYSSFRSTWALFVPVVLQKLYMNLVV